MATMAEQIERLAAADAALFAEEFPGETIGSSDWDSAAWEMAPEALREVDGAWDLYRAALRSEIETLRERATH